MFENVKNEKMLEARGTGRKDYSMKIKICKICGKKIPDGEEHYIQFKGEVCGSCFVEELKKSKEQWIKDHPCPFKYLREGLETCRQITYEEIFKGQCVGEKNCPIYNGGMK